MRLEGKVAIITGAASGMGLAMAKQFTAEGASVLAADWHEERLNEAVKSITEDGGRITGIQGNIADQATAEALVDQVVETYGKLDILVNNAGVMDYMAGVGELTDDVWKRVIGVDLEGPMFTSRKAVQHMLENGGGSIINVASTAGIHGGSGGAAYTVAKHGLVGLTRNTAWMYAKRGIRCNAICPGATMTNITESMTGVDPVGAGRTKEFTSLAPAYLQPDDIASLALFLASDESRNVNGAIIPADAGWAAV